jgi:succinyl-diaminopimelate desuccinylase
MIKIEELLELLSIKSVYDEATITVNEPYGKGVAQALAFMRDLALKHGMDIKEYDGHAIAICYGKQEERIDVVSHLDVVSADDWDEDPFVPRIVNGEIIARGTQDMKSAAYLTLKALIEIKEKKMRLKRQLRVVLGTDEERTMDDIVHYVKKAGQPKFAFTPDGAFPLSIGEKGALMWHVKGRIESPVVELKGGTQCNVIAPHCSFTVPLAFKTVIHQTVKSLGFDVKEEVDHELVRYTFTGIAGHASRPESGHNAIVDALQVLALCFPKTEFRKLYETFASPYAKDTSLAYNIEPMGPLTLNLGVCSIHNGIFEADVDCRYPYGVTSEELTQHLRKALVSFEVTLPYDAIPFLNDIQSPFIQACLSHYRKAFIDDRDPFISGGVTYGKVIQPCIAFGPLLPGRFSLAHQKNESVAIEDLELLYPFYRDILIKLANLEEEQHA